MHCGAQPALHTYLEPLYTVASSICGRSKDGVAASRSRSICQVPIWYSCACDCDVLFDMVWVFLTCPVVGPLQLWSLFFVVHRAYAHPHSACVQRCARVTFVYGSKHMRVCACACVFVCVCVCACVFHVEHDYANNTSPGIGHIFVQFLKCSTIFWC